MGRINEWVKFQRFNRYFYGKVEKELVNSFIVTIKTNNLEFNHLYHGRIAIRKKECEFFEKI